jgi:undecaprenyl-diphosphatase
MHWWADVLLGLVQGLTEFLPVSSSGHLVLMEALLGLSQEGILLEVALHSATLVAVLIFYRARVVELVRGALRGETAALAYGAKLAIATLPIVLAVLVARDFFEFLYEDPRAVGLALLVTGSLVFSTRHTIAHARASEPSFAAALAIGCAQAFAIVPGISRSGATVAVALAVGVAPVAAAEFSFLMSVIAIFGATLLQIPELSGVSDTALADLALASAVALASGVAALWLFVRLLRGRSFHRFAYYAWGLGAAVILWQILGSAR